MHQDMVLAGNNGAAKMVKCWMALVAEQFNNGYKYTGGG